ncbi:hypothetical protein LEP1GSC044_1377 [Leptospira kirschneri serovar Grippotyphosa str. RM52]|nr:hypothetical protein LEP1GSC044_1377 [Leptospira kirschneri serovar Grippotyphosa str. RM52]
MGSSSFYFLWKDQVFIKRISYALAHVKLEDSTFVVFSDLKQ